MKDTLILMEELEPPIRTVDLASKLGIPVAEAPRRMQLLREWGCLKYFSREKKGYGGYVITNHGRECIRLWKGEKSGNEES